MAIFCYNGIVHFNSFYTYMHTFFLIVHINFPSRPHIACTGAGAASDSSSVAVAAAGGFIGGVLLTAFIGAVVAVAVFCRVKRELTAATSYRLVYMLHACMSVQEMRILCNIYTCKHGTLMDINTWMYTLIWTHLCAQMHCACISIYDCTCIIKYSSTQSFMIFALIILQLDNIIIILYYKYPCMCKYINA